MFEVSCKRREILLESSMPRTTIQARRMTEERVWISRLCGEIIMGNRHRHFGEYEEFTGPAGFHDPVDASLSGVLQKGQPVRGPSEPRVTLRNAMISDSRFIGRLSRDVFAVYGPYDDILSGWFRMGNDVTTIIACMDRIPIGFAMLSGPSEKFDLPDVSELLGIAVEPERQGKGIGGMLLRAIESRSESLNIKWLFLHTAVDNIQARSLYEKTGYRSLEIKRNFYPEGQDAVVMYKSVAGHTAGKR